MELAEQMVGMLAVLGLLVGTVWMLSRKTSRPWLGFRRQPKAAGGISIADRLVLTPQHVLHLVRIGDRTLLLATHPHGVSFDPAGGDFLSEFRNSLSRPQGESK